MIASLRHEATTTTQKGMGEVAEADFATSAKQRERGGVLPGAGAVCSAVFRLEETVERSWSQEVRGSKSDARGGRIQGGWKDKREYPIINPESEVWQ